MGCMFVFHFIQEGPECCGDDAFTYAGDPPFRTMFPDTEIAKTYSSGPGQEQLLAGTCGFCL